MHARRRKASSFFLDDYVIGQQDAKETMAIAVYNHYKRLDQTTDVEISKSNILLFGPHRHGQDTSRPEHRAHARCPLCDRGRHQHDCGRIYRLILT
jgi:hypothetical protein